MGNRQQGSLFDEPDTPAAVQRVAGPDVVVREVRCKSLLNRSSIGDYSFNCYTGCAHGCVYCYARFMQRFHPHAEPWGGFVDVKVNADEVLARQLKRLKPGEVFTYSACDGWQPTEREYRLTGRCCQMLLEAGFRLNILTKSKLVLRDLGLFVGRDVCLGVTITTSDEASARLWEPGASSVSDRWEILAQARAAGLETAVMFGPLLPGISDAEPALARLFRGAAEAQVDRIWTDALNPRPRVWPSVQTFLGRHRPDLLEHYRRVLFDAAFRKEYLRQLDGRIRRAASAAGVEARIC